MRLGRNQTILLSERNIFKPVLEHDHRSRVCTFWEVRVLQQFWLRQCKMWRIWSLIGSCCQSRSQWWNIIDICWFYQVRQSDECDALVSVNPTCPIWSDDSCFPFSAEFWIGLSKNGDTWSWINGDPLIYSNWGESKPWSYPVARYQDDAFTKWDDTVHGSIETAGTLCMKGQPLRPTYTQRFSTTDMQRYSINGGGDTRIGHMPGNSGK